MGTENLIREIKKSFSQHSWQLMKEERIIDAIRAVDRANFLGDEIAGEISLDLAYSDTVIPIGYEQTCSQPSLTCIMMDELQLEEGMDVLEIGTGCAYSAAIAAEIIGQTGKLTTIEVEARLLDLAKKNLEKHFGKNYSERVEIVYGDGRKGYSQNAPYDRIYLTAGVDFKNFNKDLLIKQLKPNGIIVYPEEKGWLFAERYENGEMISQNKVCQVAFVPLVDKELAHAGAKHG